MGVEEGKYKVFRDFKIRVLDKAVEEVNKYSSFVVSPQLRKQSRQVTSIQFLIKKGNVIAISNDKNDGVLENDGLIGILRKQFGFSSKQAIEVVTQHKEKYIREKINLVQSMPSFKKGQIKNLTRYLFSALRDDYQPTKNSVIVHGGNSLADYPDKNKKFCDTETQVKFTRFQDKQLFGLFNELSEQDRTSIIKKFEKFLIGMYDYMYSRHGLENILIQDQLCIYLRQIDHPLISQLITYDVWLQQTL
jgi:hypothetical protein